MHALLAMFSSSDEKYKLLTRINWTGSGESLAEWHDQMVMRCFEIIIYADSMPWISLEEKYEKFIQESSEHIEESYAARHDLRAVLLWDDYLCMPCFRCLVVHLKNMIFFFSHKINRTRSKKSLAAWHDPVAPCCSGMTVLHALLQCLVI